MTWEKLLDHVDYRHRVWFVKDDNDEWQRAGLHEVLVCFSRLGVTDFGDTMQKFHQRDKESRARST